MVGRRLRAGLIRRGADCWARITASDEWRETVCDLGQPAGCFGKRYGTLGRFHHEPDDDSAVGSRARGRHYPSSNDADESRDSKFWRLRHIYNHSNDPDCTPVYQPEPYRSDFVHCPAEQ